MWDMSKKDKLLDRMRNNPRDWRIEELKKVADQYKVDYRQPGSSHVTFRAKNGTKLTVPARKPIKAIYIKQFLTFLESLEVGDE